MPELNYWQRLQSRRLSRRGLFKASTRAAAGGAGFALVGCGEEDDAPMVATQSASQRSEQSAPSESRPQQPEERDVQTAQDAAPQPQQQERTMTDDEIREMIEELKEGYRLGKLLKVRYERRRGDNLEEQLYGINTMAATASAIVALENELRR